MADYGADLTIRRKLWQRCHEVSWEIICRHHGVWEFVSRHWVGGAVRMVPRDRHLRRSRQSRIRNVSSGPALTIEIVVVL